MAALADEVEAEEVPGLELKGFSRPVTAYRLATPSRVPTDM